MKLNVFRTLSLYKTTYISYGRYMGIYMILSLIFMSCQQDFKTIERNEIDYNKIRAAFKSNETSILFNHLYLTLDSTTFSNLKNSEFLHHSYASIDKGLPDFDPVKNEATSFYIRGEHHYIEVLGPDNKFGEPPGRSGIGLQIAADLRNKKKFPLTRTNKKFLTATDSVTYPIRGTDIFWYRPFYTTGSIPTEVHTWYALYNPDFISKLYHKKVNTYSRKEFLEPVYDETKLLHSVTKLEIMCNAADFKRIAMEVQLLNHSWVKNEEKIKVNLADIELVLFLKSDLDKSYIENIYFRLNKEDYKTLDFGRFRIKNFDKQSTWEFYNN